MRRLASVAATLTLPRLARAPAPASAERASAANRQPSAPPRAAAPALAGAAVLRLDRAGGEAARADDRAAQGRPIRSIAANLAPGRFVAVVVEHLDPGAAQLARRDRRRRRGISRRPARRLISPTRNGATLSGQMMPASSWFASMMRADQARHADAVGAHLERHRLAVRRRRRRRPSASNTWCRNRRCGRPRCRARSTSWSAGIGQFAGIVLLVGRGVELRPLLEERLEVAVVIDVDARGCRSRASAGRNRPRSRRSRRG